mmetsp:Transcript_10566/g.15675  ORF Transcript_10566/g.15675 Transcript_10566/m.15675 type:complete len:327 (-) Transcript_10566:192-1172(-)
MNESDHQNEKAIADNPSPLPEALGYIPVGHPLMTISVESVRRAVEEFRVRPTDIICATFPKTGTTLVTWLCHQIRTGGDVDFDSIYDVVPWPLCSWDFGYDPNIVGSELVPRVFKSHLRLASVYRGCKYVVTIRDPLSTTLSFYNFFLTKNEAVSFKTRFEVGNMTEFLMNSPLIRGVEGVRASIWEFYKEYYICKDCPSVLILVYEHMVKDLPSTVRMLAKFMNVDLKEETVQKVASMGTKEFMAQHMDKFEEPYERAKQLGRIADLSHCSPADKVNLKKHNHELDDEGIFFLEKQWNKHMGSYDCETYEDFADMIQEQNNERFK